MNALINTMTSREFEKQIRTGMTVDDFCVIYGCSKEEFGDRIHTIYPQERKRKEISRKLKGNEKIKGRTPVAPETQSATEAPKKQTSAKPEKGKRTESKKPETEPKTELKTEPKPEPKTEPEAPKPTLLEIYRQKEESLSNEICRLESEHKEAWNEHRAVADNIRAITERVEQLKLELKHCIDDYEGQMAKARELEDQMSECTEAWRPKRAELDQVRTRIAELTTITVFVYDDGTIEAEDCKLSFDGWETRYDELLRSESDTLDNLRKKDLRTLAKLLSLSNNEHTFAFAFDNSELEEVFKVMKK
jgi:hypothetical protein